MHYRDERRVEQSTDDDSHGQNLDDEARGEHAVGVVVVAIRTATGAARTAGTARCSGDNGHTPTVLRLLLQLASSAECRMIWYNRLDSALIFGSGG